MKGGGGPGEFWIETSVDGGVVVGIMTSTVGCGGDVHAAAINIQAGMATKDAFIRDRQNSLRLANESAALLLHAAVESRQGM